MKRFVILSSAFLLIFFSQSAKANSIREIIAMDFGAFSVNDLNAHDIELATNGTVTMHDGGVSKLKNGRAAQFQILGLDPAAQFYITIDPTTLTHQTGSPSVNIDSFTFDPPNDINNTIHTDPDNNLTVTIGATMHIPPGTAMTRGAYRGTYNFMLNF